MLCLSPSFTGFPLFSCLLFSLLLFFLLPLFHTLLNLTSFCLSLHLFCLHDLLSSPFCVPLLCLPWSLCRHCPHVQRAKVSADGEWNIKQHWARHSYSSFWLRGERWVKAFDCITFVLAFVKSLLEFQHNVPTWHYVSKRAAAHRVFGLQDMLETAKWIIPHIQYGSTYMCILNPISVCFTYTNNNAKNSIIL